MATSGWVGFDLDGTLATYGKWNGPAAIGEPIAPMVERVKRLLEKGVEVRIFTARASVQSREVLEPIELWCARHIGRVLPITNVKDFACRALYDDRAVAVQFNTGVVLGGDEP